MPDIKQTLDGWIDYSSPKLGTFLNRTWKNQQQALTYKEIREAIFAGQLDPGYLAQWRQDYSKFIINGYAPLAQQAIDNSAHEMQQLFGLGAKSLNYPYIDSFIATQGGKLIREVSEEQYKAINVLVRQASFSETMDVKELARAIRPTVGLTTRQAQAAYNRYQQAIADGYSPDKAREIQAKYAERLHRTRAETIAVTEMAYAYNYGQQAYMEQCIKDGLIGGARKKWMTAFDERVCEVCGKLDGEEAEMDAPFSIGVPVPPAHPRCRCTVNYIDVLPPATWVDTTTAQPTQAPDNVEIPDDVDVSGMKYVQQIHLGGTGDMHLLEAPNGDEWLFKPAYMKHSHHVEDFRAYVQEAGYKVQGIIDPDSAVKVGVAEIDIPGTGKVLGSVQQRIGNLDGTFDLKAWQIKGGTLPPEVVSQLQRENVTDWLLCNYDSHGGNFILTNDGRLIGVDKEQSYRFIGQSGAQHMSLTYHPNAVIGETEPVYNTLYRKFANGEIDIRLNDTLTYIKRIEAIPDAEYREIFRNYAEALHGKGAQAEQLLDKIVARKQNVRAEFENFYSSLLTQRKGVKTTFIFADTPGAAAIVTPSPATSTFTPAALKGMKLADLHALAKAKGIKNFGILHKDELIAVISDPSQQQQVFQTALNRAHQQYATRVQRRKAGTTAGNSRQISGVTQLSDALKDIDGTLKGSTPRGVALISDTTSLEGLQTNLRKITIDGEEYYELTGKLTQTRWEKAVHDMAAQNSGYNWRFNYASGSIDYTQPVLHLSSTTETFSLNTKYIRQGDDIIVVAGTDAERSGRALMGQFNIRVKATNGTDAARKMQTLMQQAGISEIADDVTPVAIDRYKKMRLIWQTDPKAVRGLDPTTVTDTQLDRVLQKLGITQKRIDAVQVKKIRDGYWTLVDPENLALAAKHKAAYIYAETTSIDDVALMVSSGEMLPTLQRWGRGIVTSGMSSRRDIETGGADSVFTRLVFDGQVGNERRYHLDDYMLVFDTKALERTDWYAYTSDEFGRTTASTFYGRYGTEEHFKQASAHYCSSNEVCFPKTMPMTYLKEVRVPDAERQLLVDKLHAVGISEVNGIRLEKLITTIGRYV